MTASTPAPGRLLRLLGSAEGTAIAIGVAIGAGIFRAPREIAQLVSSPSIILLLWTLGGLLALLDALVLAELGAMYPQAGGHYVFLREAYGPRPAFLFGWTAAFLSWPASVAALGAAASDFAPLLGLPGRACGYLVILLPAAVHLFGLKAGARAQNFLSYTKAAVLLLFALGVLLLVPDARAAAPEAASPALPLTLGALALGLALVLWTYDGYAEAVFVSEEVRDAERNVPKALIRGILLLTLVYVGVNAAFLRCLTPAEMAGSTLVAGDAAVRLAGPPALRLVAGLALLTLLGAASATLLSGPRISFAMARDGCLPRAFTRVTRRGTPIVALATMTLAALLYYSFNTFNEVVLMTIFAIWCFVTLTTLALFLLRRRQPDRPRPFRVPLYPWLPAALLLVAAGFLLEMVLHSRSSVLQGLAVMAGGLLLYELARGRGRTR